MKTHRMVTLVTATVLVGAIGVQPATASDPSTEFRSASAVASSHWTGNVPDGMEYDPSTGMLRSDVLAIDATTICEQTGADYKQTLAHLRAQQQNDEVYAKLEARFPDSFAGMYWDDNGRPVAQFKNWVPAGADALIAAGGANGRSEVVRFSAADLDRQMAELEAYIQSLGITDYSVGVDGRNNRVIATVSTGGRVAGTAITKAAVAARLSTDLIGAAVVVDVIDGPVFTPWTVVGGAELGTNGFDCTSGFSVSSGSTTGTATAGHCGSSETTYFDGFTGETRGLTYKNGNLGIYGDFEWFTTTGTEVDDFYHTPAGAIRDVKTS